VSTIVNTGGCSSCTTAFRCVCEGPTTLFTGDVGVVGGYLQPDRTTGVPPATDCDSNAERGRMKYDPAANLMWICANSGWVSK